MICLPSLFKFRWVNTFGLKSVTTLVTSPRSNGVADGFVETLRRDYARLAEQPGWQTVMAQPPKWFDNYNFNICAARWVVCLPDCSGRNER
jgi:hypothetical protein